MMSIEQYDPRLSIVEVNPRKDEMLYFEILTSNTDNGGSLSFSPVAR